MGFKKWKAKRKTGNCSRCGEEYTYLPSGFSPSHTGTRRYRVCPVCHDIYAENVSHRGWRDCGGTIKHNWLILPSEVSGYVQTSWKETFFFNLLTEEKVTTKHGVLELAWAIIEGNSGDDDDDSDDGDPTPEPDPDPEEGIDKPVEQELEDLIMSVSKGAGEKSENSQ